MHYSDFKSYLSFSLKFSWVTFHVFSSWNLPFPLIAPIRIPRVFPPLGNPITILGIICMLSMLLYLFKWIKTWYSAYASLRYAWWQLCDTFLKFFSDFWTYRKLRGKYHYIATTKGKLSWIKKTRNSQSLKLRKLSKF